jgi:hypothetical protein
MSIIGSNLVSFLPGISPAERSRTLDCLMFAELYAGTVHKRDEAWASWMGIYHQMLPVTGFERTATLNEGPTRVGNMSGFKRETDKMVARIASPELAMAARRALEAMGNSDHAQQFFGSWFHFSSGRSESLQVVPCGLNNKGQISIVVCGLQMTTRTRVRPLSKWPFKYEMALTMRGGSYFFQGDAYEINRERIEEELKRAGDALIQPIHL